MAWWQRQRGQYVYLFYRLGGKIVSLPRSRTKHLDSLNDASVDIWFDDWKQKNQSTANRKGSIIKHVDRYCKFLRDIGRAPKTVWEHRHSLTEYVVPYFLHRHPILENPNQWPSRSLKFSDYVMDVRKKSNHTCRKAVAALKYFYRFLTEEGIVYTGMPLRLRCPSRPQNHTPLKTTILPADVLSFAYTNEPVFSMMAVIGFFFSLRTFELMALRPIDFIAGTKAQSLECCRVMVKYGHFNRLAVRVHRQRRADGTFNEPKRASFGYVALSLALCSFDFLGFNFKPRMVRSQEGKFFLSFTPGVSAAAKKAMRQTIKGWKLRFRVSDTLEDIANAINPVLRGWCTYYGKLNKTSLRDVWNDLNWRLAKWVGRKYKRLETRRNKCTYLLGNIAKMKPQLFVHWAFNCKPTAG